MIVYDNKTKLSGKAKILEVLGNNTYLADSGRGPKHVSGDLISRVSEKVSERVIGGGDLLIQDIGNDYIVNDNDDNVSIASESSMGSDILYINDNVAPHNNVRVRKKRRTQVEQLGQPDAALQRLRPRNR